MPQSDSVPTQEFTPLQTDAQSGSRPPIDMGGMFICGLTNGQPGGEITR